MTKRWRHRWQHRGPLCSERARGVRSQRGTTRRWPPGTGWRSRPSPRPVDCSGRSAIRPQPSRPPRPSSVGCWPKTAHSVGRGRMAGPWVRACSRTTPTLPRACSRCTRRRSTSAGSPWLAPGRRDPRAVRRSGGRLLRHGCRPRAAHHSTKGPAGQRDPVRRCDGATVLLRLAAFSGEGRYRDAAERAIGTVAPLMSQYPTAFAQWLVASSFAAGDAVEVAVIGDPAKRRDASCWSRCGRRGGRSRCSLRRRAERRGRVGGPPAPRTTAGRRQSRGLRLSRLRVSDAGHDRVPSPRTAWHQSVGLRSPSRDLPRPSSCCGPDQMGSRRC